MSDVVQMPTRLDRLAEEACALHMQIETTQQVVIDKAREAGLKLIEAKGLTGHGNWLTWLKEKTTISRKTAWLYMQIAELDSANVQRVRHLPLREVAGLIASLPPEERTALSKKSLTEQVGIYREARAAGMTQLEAAHKAKFKSTRDAGRADKLAADLLAKVDSGEIASLSSAEKIAKDGAAAAAKKRQTKRPTYIPGPVSDLRQLTREEVGRPPAAIATQLHPDQVRYPGMTNELAWISENGGVVIRTKVERKQDELHTHFAQLFGWLCEGRDKFKFDEDLAAEWSLLKNRKRFDGLAELVRCISARLTSLAAVIDKPYQETN